MPSAAWVSSVAARGAAAAGPQLFTRFGASSELSGKGLRRRPCLTYLRIVCHVESCAMSPLRIFGLRVREWVYYPMFISETGQFIGDHHGRIVLRERRPGTGNHSHRPGHCCRRSEGPFSDVSAEHLRPHFIGPNRIQLEPGKSHRLRQGVRYGGEQPMGVYDAIRRCRTGQMRGRSDHEDDQVAFTAKPPRPPEPSSSLEDQGPQQF